MNTGQVYQLNNILLLFNNISSFRSAVHSSKHSLHSWNAEEMGSTSELIGLGVSARTFTAKQEGKTRKRSRSLLVPMTLCLGKMSYPYSINNINVFLHLDVSGIHVPLVEDFKLFYALIKVVCLVITLYRSYLTCHVALLQTTKIFSNLASLSNSPLANKT